MVRMKFAAHFYYSIDINCKPFPPSPTSILTEIIGDDYGIAILSTIELALSIICVCFPAVKLLFAKHFPTQPPPPPNLNRSQSLQLTTSHASTHSQSKILLINVQRKLSSIFRRSQTSLPGSDEETPPLAELRLESRPNAIISPSIQINAL